jgi:hypothetical protein
VAPQPPDCGFQQQASRAFAPFRGLNRYGDDFGSRPDAGKHIPANVPAPHQDEKQIPTGVEIFCKQVAIVCIAGKNGPLDLEDSIHIGQAETPYSKFRGHSAILYFGALGAP